jgi:hypothetical protein
VKEVSRCAKRSLDGRFEVVELDGFGEMLGKIGVPEIRAYAVPK